MELWSSTTCGSNRLTEDTLECTQDSPYFLSLVFMCAFFILLPLRGDGMSRRKEKLSKSPAPACGSLLSWTHLYMSNVAVRASMNDDLTA